MRRLGHIPALDGVRGIAILLVLFHHLHTPLASGGDSGVDLFFILSGFLITKLLIEERDKSGRNDMWAFYRRRAFRIIPALVAASVGAIAVAYIWRSDARPVVWIEVAYSLGFAGNLRDLFHPGGGFPLMGATWSLGIEEQFYWAWPALLMLVPAIFVGGRRTAKRIIVTAITLGFISRLGIGYFGGVEKHSLIPFLNIDGLLLGAGMAFALHHRDDDAPPHSFYTRGGQWLLIAAVAIDFYAAERYLDSTFELRTLFIRYAFAGIVWWLLTSGSTSWVAKLMEHPVLRWFGLISYSLYLWHTMIFAAFRLDAVTTNPVPRKLAGLIVALLVSWLSYRFVEAPAQDMRRRIDKRRAEQAAAVDRVLQDVTVGTVPWLPPSGPRHG